MTNEELEQIKQIIKAEVSAAMGTAKTDNVRKTFEEYSWEEINDICEGNCEVSPEDVWEIGEEKPFKLITGEENALRIIGFNHDKRADGKGKAGITVMFKNVVDGYYPWNYSGSTAGGYGKSDIHKTLERLFVLLPSEISNIIKPIIKYTGVGGGKAEVEQSIENLFLLSLPEVGGDEYDDCCDEGEQYEFFKDEDNRILFNLHGETSDWWLRSPNTANAGTAYRVSTGGNCYSYYYSANYAYGVAPACSI